MLIQRPARCLFYVCVKCKPFFQSENSVNSHELPDNTNGEKRHIECYI